MHPSTIIAWHKDYKTDPQIKEFMIQHVNKIQCWMAIILAITMVGIGYTYLTGQFNFFSVLQSIGNCISPFR